MVKDLVSTVDSRLTSRLAWLFGAILVLGTVCIYAQVVEFDFVAFDDDYNIVFNPHLGPLSVGRIEWAFGDWSYARRCLPLGWLGFCVVFGWSGLDPAGWHLVNLSLHVVCALLFFLVLRSLVSGQETGRPVAEWKEVAAFLGAACWAWHPLRAETVGWSSGLLYGQAHALLLGAIMCRWNAPTMIASRPLAWLLYLCSLLTYPVALGFAPVFGLHRWWRGSGWRAAVREAAPFVVIAALVLLANVLARHNAPVPTLGEVAPVQRLWQAIAGWGYYIWRPFWPLGLTPVNTATLDDFLGLWAVLPWLCLIAVGLSWRRSRWFFLAYLCVLAPFLGWLEEVAFFSDRYAALPNGIMAVGLTLGVVGIGPLRLRMGATILAGVCVAGMAILSARQVKIWRNTDWLHQRIVDQLGAGAAPAYSRVFYSRWLMRVGRPEEALALLDQALASHPGDATLGRVRQELAALDNDNREQARVWGMSRPPPLDARLHWQIAMRQLQAGEEYAASVHMGEVRRIAPEYYDKSWQALLGKKR